MRGPERRLAIWGSSVAAGAGDESEQGGYAGRLARLLQPDGWQLFNQSLGGDNTASLALRFAPGENPQPDTSYLSDVNPSYVVIGLSLGNEGISQSDLARAHRWSESDQEADEKFGQFASGMQHLMSRCRDAGVVPIVALPYARGDFSAQEYARTVEMNLLINSWDAPSVNLLGAVDDGHGRWTDGFWADPYHPNSAGHRELSHAFVPSLFAALESAKPAPAIVDSSGCTLGGSNSPLLSFAIEDTLRSFSLTFQVQLHEDTVIASIGGQNLAYQTTVVHRTWEDWEWDSETLDLTPAGAPFEATLAVSDGQLSYHASTQQAVVTQSRPIGCDWHDVTLTHYVARGETLLYLDSELVGSVTERLQPDEFRLGGDAANALFRNWMIHRAGLTRDEVVALHSGRFLPASLELYAPLLNDEQVGLRNHAQSLSAIKKAPRR